MTPKLFSSAFFSGPDGSRAGLFDQRGYVRESQLRFGLALIVLGRSRSIGGGRPGALRALGLHLRRRLLLLTHSAFDVSDYGIHIPLVPVLLCVMDLSPQAPNTFCRYE